MSEYYFFNEIKKVRDIEQWFKRTFNGIVYLEHTTPVTFTIDNVTYTIRYVSETDTIYTIKLYGNNKNIRPYHDSIRKKIEKYLNALKVR